jgi:outer membrane murein-binding lipoprotein Lpp
MASTPQQAVADPSTEIPSISQTPLDATAREEEETRESLAPLTNAESSNQEIRSLFHLVEGYWGVQAVRQAKLDKLSSKIIVLEGKCSELETDMREKQQTEAFLQKLRADQAGMDAVRLYQEVLLNLHQVNQKLSTQLATVKREVALLKESRNEVLREITEFKERAKCHEVQLRNKRSGFGWLESSEGEQPTNLAGPAPQPAS